MHTPEDGRLSENIHLTVRTHCYLLLTMKNGQLKASLKARLEEMKARHAETDRQLEDSRQAAYEAMADMKRIFNQIEETC